MVAKKLAEITCDDIASLIQNQVREGKTIEYKRSLPDRTDGGKVEFLADVSSFANTGGGDLILGVEEAAGLPVRIVGVGSPNLDQEILRLEGLIRDGLDPRVTSCEIRAVECADGSTVVVVRAGKSWNSPHRVTLGGHAHFYGRNSAGKHCLDASELRTAFTLSEQVTDRIRRFRVDRIAAIGGGEMPVPMTPGGKILLHLVPVQSFATRTVLDVAKLYEHPEWLPPIGGGGWNHRLTLDGFLTHTNRTPEPAWTYTLLFRSGILEAVEAIDSFGMPDDRKGVSGQESVFFPSSPA